MVRIEKYKDLQVEENVEIILGEGCAFNGMRIHNDGSIKCTTRPTVRIGCHFHSGKGCIIRTSDHDFSRGYPLIHGAVAGYKCADVTIGDYVWLGDDILVMKGVTIGDGAVIQARSVVVTNIPPLAIAGGHPCRPFSSRDPEEYEFLKSLDLARIKKEEAAEKRAWFDQRLAEFKAKRTRPTGES